MRDTTNLVSYKGDVCVKTTTTLSTDPLQIVDYWPVGISTLTFIRNYWPLEEIEVHETSNPGLYRITHKNSYSSQDLFLELVDGGRTKAIFHEVIPYPCPKVREGIQTRYFFGTWQKYLKSKGWVPA